MLIECTNSCTLSNWSANNKFKKIDLLSEIQTAEVTEPQKACWGEIGERRIRWECFGGMKAPQSDGSLS